MGGHLPALRQGDNDDVWEMCFFLQNLFFSYTGDGALYSKINLNRNYKKYLQIFFDSFQHICQIICQGQDRAIILLLERNRTSNVSQLF